MTKRMTPERFKELRKMSAIDSKTIDHELAECLDEIEALRAELAAAIGSLVEHDKCVDRYNHQLAAADALADVVDDFVDPAISIEDSAVAWAIDAYRSARGAK